MDANTIPPIPQLKDHRQCHNHDTSKYALPVQRTTDGCGFARGAAPSMIQSAHKKDWAVCLCVVTSAPANRERKIECARAAPTEVRCLSLECP